MLLTIGFTESEMNKIRSVLSEWDVYGVPENFKDLEIRSIIQGIEDSASDVSDWHEKKFFLIHDLDRDEIVDVVEKVKELDMGRIIFASTTPTSMDWELEKAIKEWVREDESHKKKESGN